MEIILWYFLILLIVFLVLYIFEFAVKAKKNELGINKAFSYIVKKYDLKMDKQRVRLLSKVIVFTNSFILSIPITMVIFLNIGFYQTLGISLVIFITLIISLYNIVGIIYKKKGW